MSICVNKISLFSKLLFMGVILSVGGLIMFESDKACAQNLESNVCDTDVWNTIVSRAWIEAQREVEMNQSFITQPDSVLELGCFDYFREHAAQTVGQFSDAATSGALDAITFSSAHVAVSTYLSNNFGGNELGGGTLMDGYAFGVPPTISVNCSAMARVWTHFKCSNMPDLHAVVFDSMKGDDPRKNYTGTVANSCGPAPAGGTAPGGGFAPFSLVDRPEVWTEAIRRLNSADVAGSIASYFDLVTTFSDMTAPTGACADPIATGVLITTAGGGAPVQEMICPNPGCSYDGTNCVR